MSRKLKIILNTLTNGGWFDSTERNDLAESITHEGLALRIYLPDSSDPIEGDNIFYVCALDDYTARACLVATPDATEVIHEVNRITWDEAATANRLAVVKAERGELTDTFGG